MRAITTFLVWEMWSFLSRVKRPFIVGELATITHKAHWTKPLRGRTPLIPRQSAVNMGTIWYTFSPEECSCRAFVKLQQFKEKSIMSALRKKMIRDLELRRFLVSTQKSYIAAVRGLAKYYMLSPDKISKEQLLEYVHFLITKRKLSCSYYTLCVTHFV